MRRTTSIRHAVVLGLQQAVTSALSQSVSNIVGAAQVLRVGGATRDGTAVAIDQHYFGSVPKGAVVSTNGAAGSSFVDALSAAALAANNGVPIVLTNPAGLPSTTRSYLIHIAKRSAVWVVGGPQAVQPSVTAEITRLLP